MGVEVARHRRERAVGMGTAVLQGKLWIGECHRCRKRVVNDFGGGMLPVCFVGIEPRELVTSELNPETSRDLHMTKQRFN